MNNHISSMARHFVYSIIQHDKDSVLRITDHVSNLDSEQITNFLLSLGGTLDAHHSNIEKEFSNYTELKKWTCDFLKNPHRCQTRNGGLKK